METIFMTRENSETDESNNFFKLVLKVRLKKLK